MSTHMGDDPAARSTRRVQQLQHSQDAEQQTPANTGTPTTFPESSHRTVGKIGARPCPGLNQLPAHAGSQCNAGRILRAGKMFQQQRHFEEAKCFLRISGSILWGKKKKKKRRRIIKVTSEMWTYQSGGSSSARSLVAALLLLAHQLTPAAIPLLFLWSWEC